MFCPQCGQQQVSDMTRFCSRCGFLLEGTTMVLASGGTAPMRYGQGGNKKPSARSQGVRQGAALMLSGILVVPVVSILAYNLLYPVSHIIIPLSALLCFVGGLFRILYALLMEDANPPMNVDQMGGYSQPSAAQLNQPLRNAALPPAAANATASWRPRPTTAEIYQPPSVTENTTRLLDKDEKKSR